MLANMPYNAFKNSHILLLKFHCIWRYHTRLWSNGNCRRNSTI